MITLEIRMRPHNDVKDKIRFAMIAEDLRRFWNDYIISQKIHNDCRRSYKDFGMII